MYSHDPYEVIDLWLDQELKAGAPNPRHGVLSTTTSKLNPHARVVAIKEISPEGLLFFTQSGTRKVTEMHDNPSVSFTFWLEINQREIILEGAVSALTKAENELHWNEYPKEAQIRFYSYASTSSKPIQSKDQLEEIRLNIEKQYQQDILPVSPYYCGFRIIPNRIIFYDFRTDELSDVKEYELREQGWSIKTLSP